MLDLNHILLFLALVSPLVVLWRSARQNRGWKIAAVAVLAITAIAWLIGARQAGWIGGIAWFLLLLLPAVGLRRVVELARLERYSVARKIAVALQPLHPTKTLRDELIFLRAMEAAQLGETENALRALQTLPESDTRAGLQATAQSFRIRGDWSGLVAWYRLHFPPIGLGREPAVFPLYLRALGETGDLDELIRQLAGRAPILLASPQHQGIFDSSQMVMLAFAGRTESLVRLFEHRFQKVAAETKEFLIGTSELAAGKISSGHTRLQALAHKTSDALLRAEIAKRLSVGYDPRASINPANLPTLRRFENAAGAPPSGFLGAQTGVTPAVLAILGMNAAMFFLEIYFGGSQNSIVLQRLGALEPSAVFQFGQYWRLLTALFLHYGALHLLVNAYALYVLGPSLEASIGTLRFIICYLASGIGSSAGVALFWRLGLTHSDLVVGASGAVMGIVGTWAGLLLGDRHLPMARRRLWNIAIIVAIQSAFDLSTPQVSMSAHLSGFVSGVIVGWLIAPRRAIG